MLSAQRARALGSSHPGAARLSQGTRANCCGLGWRGPALLASGVSESRHWGAAGRTSLFACGRLGRRDERARQVLQYIPRSLVSAPAVHHSVSRWRRPAAGWAGRIDNPLRSRTNARENPGDCQHWKENERGSKLFRRKFTQALTHCQHVKRWGRVTVASVWEGAVVFAALPLVSFIKIEDLPYHSLDGCIWMCGSEQFTLRFCPHRDHFLRGDLKWPIALSLP